MTSTPVPVTLLCGFFGSGKTALRAHILQQCGELRIGVLVNEVKDGCFCCSQREELQQEVARLAKDFDYLLIETSGLAEPGPIATALPDGVRLDTVVTVVDAAAFLRDYTSADDLYERGLSPDATDDRTVTDLLIAQVEGADTLILNKCDLVKPIQLDRMEEMFRYFNPHATVLRAEFGAVTVEQVLNTERFDGERVADGAGCLQLLHGELPEIGKFGLGGFVYRARRPFHPERFWQWLQQGQDGVLRARGFFWLATRMELAGAWCLAGQACQIRVAGRWRAAYSQEYWPTDPVDRAESQWQEPFGDRRQELALIGINLKRAAIAESLDACLLTAEEFAAGSSIWAEWPDDFGDWPEPSYDDPEEDPPAS